ncbi:IniB N-terminal domain-containing protein [Lentzea sp. NPDC051213]|uniref:IniB N-terminal domain-containing protein n=1 Tax=Lentzea sp. NPDC051213 TaxID=3364126 RepID=UPI0037932F40
MGTQTTLHDFTLTLLGDLDARAEFQADPEGTLDAAGLSDITAADLHDILPLVLDAASVVNVDAIDQLLAETGDLTAADQLTAIVGNVEGVTTITDVAAPSTITALVKDFSDLGDVSNTLDATVLKGTDVVSNVSDNSVVAKVTDVADVKDVADVLVKDIDTDVLVKDLVDTDVLVKNTDVLVKDVADVDVADVADVTDNVVQDVAQVGDIHNSIGQVVGDVNVGDIDVLDGGVGNGNDVDIHL